MQNVERKHGYAASRNILNGYNTAIRSKQYSANDHKKKNPGHAFVHGRDLWFNSAILFLGVLQNRQLVGLHHGAADMHKLITTVLADAPGCIPTISR